jgi:hypothetical protein
MHAIRKRVARSIAIAGSSLALVAILAGPAFAAGQVVGVGRQSLDGVFHDDMICGWGATFTSTGQLHWTFTNDPTGPTHVTVQESVAYTLTIDDDASVPTALRGVTWRGHSVIAFVQNVDPSSARAVIHSVQPFWEGPFRALSERFALIVAADGTVRVDRTIVDFDVDCDALAAAA